MVRAQRWALGTGIIAHTSAQEAVFCGERLGKRRLEGSNPEPSSEVRPQGGAGGTLPQEWS